ncbi:MAG TPA: type VI secretion system baseplate subunit TssK [Pyrinomonadaceae bacterium]|nr:type VI secretion system baseplate subunit TssK [Pyrinomonadaceae bacterium]
MDANEIPDSIHWHEGLLLTPQHFQQLSLRQEALLQYSASLLAPFSWGIRYLKLDEPSLFSGLVLIKHVEAVMPDGLVVSHQEGDDLQIDLNSSDGAKDKRLKVYLAVARQARPTSRGENARYSSVEGEAVVDEFTGEGKVRMLRLVPRLQLMVSDAPPKKAVSLPLIEVEYKDDGFVQTDFIPPLLTVTLSPQLGAQSRLGIECEKIADKVRNKAQDLAGLADVQSPGAAQRLDLETKSWIRNLTASLPYLEAILNTKVSHPYPVFLALCSMAGHLSALGTKLVPDKPFYNHNDLQATFQPVIKFIEQAIDKGLTSTYQSYPFTYTDGVFEREFEAAWKQRRLILGLRGQPGVSENDLIKWGEQCLIGSKLHLQSMREKRILGAKRMHIKGDGDLVPSRGVVLFSLKADSEFIEPNALLQIFNPGEYGHRVRPAEIVLHVKNDAEAVRQQP